MKRTRHSTGLGSAALALLLGSGLLLGSASIAAAEGHNHRDYRSAHRGFITARPAIGTVVASLPVGALRISIGASHLFVNDDVYYRAARRGYVVVEKPGGRRSPYPTAAVATVRVQVPLLNVRSGPGTHFPVVDRTWQGEMLTVSGAAPGWHYVVLPSGNHGWIMSCFATPPAAG